MKTHRSILIWFSFGCALLICGSLLLAQASPHVKTLSYDTEIRVIQRSWPTPMPEIAIPVPPSISISGGGFDDWLVISRHNLKAYDAKAFDPIYTSVVCQFRPKVTKQADGTFLVEFESDLP